MIVLLIVMLSDVLLVDAALFVALAVESVIFTGI